MGVYVCVRQRLFQRVLTVAHAGGPSMCCERWSNEAATTHADMQSDQLHVPAFLASCDNIDYSLPRTEAV